MYEALYRKYRSRTFGEVVGQDHITKTLREQVSSGRVGHAYLFTGTRGTGKTSCARILARAVNCLSPRNGEPCNESVQVVCKGILDGSITDVTELDAASNNSVNDVRDLREELIFTPAVSRRRVYIIDEVHMLSTSAFNALLKSLEEPPEYVMFILATTEIQKVPATILSRCQRFNFRRLSVPDIGAHLKEIAQKEHIDLEAEAAERIARLSDGAMRDGVAILDQCAVGRNEVTLDIVNEMLGLIDRQEAQDLFNEAVSGDSAAALSRLNRLYYEGKTMSSVIDEMIHYLRDLLVYRTSKRSDLTSTPESVLRSENQKISGERILYSLSLLQSTAEKLSKSLSPKIDLEIAIVQISEPSLAPTIESLNERLRRLEECGLPIQTEKRGKEQPEWAFRQEPEIHQESQITKPVVTRETPNQEVQNISNKDETEKLWEKILESSKNRLDKATYSTLALRQIQMRGKNLYIIAESDFEKLLLGRPILEQIEETASEILSTKVNVSVATKDELKEKTLRKEIKWMI